MSDNLLTKETGIKITTGFLIQLFVSICSLAGMWYNMKSDLTEALRISTSCQELVQKQDQIIRRLEIDLSAINRSYSDFRTTYEQDMNRWIREPRVAR